MRSALGVDFSSHGGPLGADTVRHWRNRSVDYAIVQYSEFTKSHIDALEAGGMPTIEEYVYLYNQLSPWHQTPMDRTERAIEFGGGRISLLWLDWEDQTKPWLADQAHRCEELVIAAGIQPGIYTGKWWWLPSTKDYRGFSHLPLWDAFYTAEGSPAKMDRQPADINVGFGRGYGGWKSRHTLQWHNTTRFEQHTVDLNIRLVDDATDQEDDVATIWVCQTGFAPAKSWLVTLQADQTYRHRLVSQFEHYALDRTKLAGFLTPLPNEELNALGISDEEIGA